MMSLARLTSALRLASSIKTRSPWALTCMVGRPVSSRPWRGGRVRSFLPWRAPASLPRPFSWRLLRPLPGLFLFQLFVLACTGGLGGCFGCRGRCGIVGTGGCGASIWRNAHCSGPTGLLQDALGGDVGRRWTVAEHLAAVFVDPLPLSGGAQCPSAGHGQQEKLVHFHGDEFSRARCLLSQQ